MASRSSVPPLPPVDDASTHAAAREHLSSKTALVAGRVGRRVRSERLAQGRSQEEVASRTLIARNSLQTIELADKSNPRLSTLVGLADTLGVTVAYLVGDDSTDNSD